MSVTFKANQDKAKQYADNRRNAKESPLFIGDKVLVRQKKLNKFTTPFHPSPYTVVAIKGSMITAKSQDHTVTRNRSYFKRLDREHQALTQKSKPLRLHMPTSTPPQIETVSFPQIANNTHATAAAPVTETAEVPVTVTAEVPFTAAEEVPVTVPTEAPVGNDPESQASGDSQGIDPKQISGCLPHFRPNGRDTGELECSDFSFPESFKTTARSGRTRQQIKLFQGGSS